MPRDSVGLVSGGEGPGARGIRIAGAGELVGDDATDVGDDEVARGAFDWRGLHVFWRALRSRIRPMKKVARTLRAHEQLILNGFRAQGEISSAAVEGLNDKIRVVTRRSYGFGTYWK